MILNEIKKVSYIFAILEHKKDLMQLFTLLNWIKDPYKPNSLVGVLIYSGQAVCADD